VRVLRSFLISRDSGWEKGEFCPQRNNHRTKTSPFSPTSANLLTRNNLNTLITRREKGLEDEGMIKP
jgi:hypothetical protein